MSAKGRLLRGWAKLQGKEIHPNVSFSRKFIFIHIPKTAGTSAGRALGFSRTDHARYDQYVDYVGKKCIEDYYVCCVVRNPLARFFSLYNYSRLLRSHYHSNVPGESSLCGPHMDYDLLSSASLNECARYLVEGRLVHDHRWNHWMPQVTWLTGAGDQTSLDKIIKAENLEAGLREVCAEVGFRFEEVGRSNRSNTGGYVDAFDSETKAIVHDFYRDDFDAFGYSFND